MIEFGILKDGRVQFVDVVQHSEYAIYDEYAVNAIKLASPFPPVPRPDGLGEAGQPGVPILARFNYIVEILARPTSSAETNSATPGPWLDTASNRCVA